jgi:ABC-type phosphate/phosphonate transport system substrate-binding protein
MRLKILFLNVIQFLKLTILTTTLCAISFPALADHKEEEELRIGVLAKRGPEVTKKRWSETAAYLSEEIPGHTFSIVPLSFDEIAPAVNNHKVDFLLTNPGMFVNLSFNNELFALATLKRNILNQAFTEFGSVIFTRKDHADIHHLKDLIDEDVAAVNKDSLGGWIAALRDLDSIGVTEESFHSLKFLGTHDAVVYAVENKMVDVGIVRTDALERMQAEGKTLLADFNILPPLKNMEEVSSINFPLVRSTRLYPEWPFASLSHISEEIAEKNIRRTNCNAY